MAGACTVCTHDDRKAIDVALVTGTSYREITRKYGPLKDALSRHKAGHVSPALAKVVARREEAGPVTALARIEALYGRASKVLDAAELEGKAALSLQAVRELRGLVELLARLSGELDERPQIAVLNLTASAEWGAVRGVVLAALRSHPEAAADVVRALGAVES